jgi:hypothetical protein
MKRLLALLFQTLVMLVGVGAFAFLLWEPQVEGRNAHATPFEIYFKDPFLAYVYVASTPFFFALWRAFGLLGHFQRHGTFSPGTVAALQTIGRCAFAIIGFAVGGVIALGLFGEAEPPGFVMCFLIALASGVVALAARKAARTVQQTLRQSEATDQ